MTENPMEKDCVELRGNSNIHFRRTSDCSDGPIDRRFNTCLDLRRRIVYVTRRRVARFRRKWPRARSLAVIAPPAIT